MNSDTTASEHDIKPAARNWIARHWRGETSLLRAFLQNAVLTYVFLFSLEIAFFLFVIFGPKGTFTGSHVLLVILSVIGIVVVSLAALIWMSVGIYRSSKQRSGFAGTIPGRISACALSLAPLVFLISDLNPHFYGTSSPYTPKPHAISLIGPDSAGFSGEFGIHATEDLVKFLDAHPEMKRLELNSTGGLAYEAMATRDLLRRRSLDTSVRGTCEGVCTIAYLGGKARYLSPRDGRLVFRPFSEDEGRPGAKTLSDMKADATANGVATAFIEQAYTGRDTPWPAPPETLLAAGYITQIVE